MRYTILKIIIIALGFGISSCENLNDIELENIQERLKPEKLTLTSGTIKGSSEGEYVSVKIVNGPILDSDSIENNIITSIAAIELYEKLKEKNLDWISIKLNRNLSGENIEIEKKYTTDTLKMVYEHYSTAIEFLNYFIKQDYEKVYSLLDSSYVKIPKQEFIESMNEFDKENKSSDFFTLNSFKFSRDKNDIKSTYLVFDFDMRRGSSIYLGTIFFKPETGHNKILGIRL